MGDDDDDDGFDYGDQGDLFGTDPKFLHRAEGPETSIISAYSIDSKKYERAVLAVIETFDAIGCISDQVRHVFPEDTPYSTVTARYKALDDHGFIRRSKKDTRPGGSRRPQMVMRITPLGRSALDTIPPQPDTPGDHPIPG